MISQCASSIALRTLEELDNQLTKQFEPQLRKSPDGLSLVQRCTKYFGNLQNPWLFRCQLTIVKAAFQGGSEFLACKLNAQSA